MNIESIKKGVLCKFPLLGSIIASTSFVSSDKAQTAETDGSKVYYSPTYVSKLTDDERIFLFAHEIMHISFDHIARSKDRDHKIWNQATDAVINQMLKGMSLPMPHGGIDMPEASGKSAEEMYDYLLKNKNKQTNEEQSQHGLWEDAANEMNEMPQDKLQKSSESEKRFVNANEELKTQMGQSIRQQLEQQKNDITQAGFGHGGNVIHLQATGPVNNVINWKKILRKELDKAIDKWSYRRADEDNDYQARIQTIDDEGKYKIEIMLDTSGSVRTELLREFLKQIKTLIRDAELHVGCFDTKFYGFQRVKTLKDVDNLSILGRGGTDFDIALASFSKQKDVHRIVFSDGYSEVTRNAVNEKIKNLYWLIWGNNKKFAPCCGKVIFVDEKQFCFIQNKLTTCTIQPNHNHLKKADQITNQNKDLGVKGE